MPNAADNNIAKPIIGRRSTGTEMLSPRDRTLLKGCLSSGDLKSMSLGGLKSVSFHQIEIREYERSLGDNPSVHGGPPISLGWNYNPTHTVVELEDYERFHSRRTRSEIIMPRSVREEILKDAGVSRKQMGVAAKSATITKNRRAKSATLSPKRDKADYALESLGRKFIGGVAKVFQQRRRGHSVSLIDAPYLHVSQPEVMRRPRSKSLSDLAQLLEETEPVEREEEEVVEELKPSTGGSLGKARSQSCGTLSSDMSSTDQLNEMSAMNQSALKTGTIEEISAENATTEEEDWAIGEFDDDAEFEPQEYFIPVL
jgi:hypothetical protein